MTQQAETTDVTPRATVAVSVADAVAVVRLTETERRNPLSLETMRSVTGALRGIGARPDVRAVVVEATGPVFSAGHDLTEMVDRTLDDEREIFQACTEMMETVQSIPQPVIAAVQGAAIAAE